MFGRSLCLSVFERSRCLGLSPGIGIVGEYLFFIELVVDSCGLLYLPSHGSSLGSQFFHHFVFSIYPTVLEWSKLLLIDYSSITVHTFLGGDGIVYKRDSDRYLT